MSTPPGLLSGSITNINNLTAQMKSQTLLPLNAVPIQQDAISLFRTDIADIQAAQAAILSYTTQAQPVMNDLLTKLKAGTLISPVDIASLTTMNTEAINLQATVTSLSTAMGITRTTLIGLEAQLTPIQNALSSQLSSANTQLQAAQKQAAFYNSRKYYWLALGPFGLIGLGIAIGMIISWNDKANSYQSQAAAINMEVAGINTLVSNINTLTNNFSLAVNSISNVQNATDFLAADINDILTDLNSATVDKLAAQLYLTTALGEVQALATAAS